jgi:peptide/nickel transport system substrate-binding protein
MRYVKVLVLLTLVVVLLGIVKGQTFADGGGIIIEPNSNSGTDVATLNPLLGNDVYSQRVYGFMFPNLIGIDPKIGLFAEGARNGLAKSWKYSDDGKTITYTLRQDWKWTDGTPVTAADWIYSYNAIASGKITSPRSYAVAVIDKVESPDPYTLVVHYKTPACNNINNTNAIIPIPAHVFQKEIGTDYAKINDMSFNKGPGVTAGVFKFAEFRAGDQVSLAANQDFPDKLGDSVKPDGFIYKNVPDVTVALQRFLAGDLNVMAEGVAPQDFKDLRDRATKGEIKTFEQLDNGYQWMAFNMADPKNPQPGMKDGKTVDQGHHPIFGDVRVRRAIAMGLDMDAIIKGALFGEGVRVASPAIPSSWAYSADLKPPAYDPEAAKKLLAEAGWVDDGSGGLKAKGAMYAADGTALKFDLISGAGDKAVEATGQLIQDQLKKIGVSVNYQAIDFNTAVQKLIGQTFDAALLGWRLAYPDDPDFGFAFNPENDVVSSGFNFVSYNNPKVTEILKQGNDLPGCDTKERAKLYQQAQALLAQDQPYVFLYTQKRIFLASGKMEGFGPYVNQLYWNVDAWSLSQ